MDNKKIKTISKVLDYLADKEDSFEFNSDISKTTLPFKGLCGLVLLSNQFNTDDEEIISGMVKYHKDVNHIDSDFLFEEGQVEPRIDWLLSMKQSLMV